MFPGLVCVYAVVFFGGRTVILKVLKFAKMVSSKYNGCIDKVGRI